MKDIDLYLEQLLSAAKNAGTDAAEANYSENETFSVKIMGGKIDSYESSNTGSLSFPSFGGRMGYASTQAFDLDSIEQIISDVKEAAELNEAQEQDEIFKGEKCYPEIKTQSSDLDQHGADERIGLAKMMENAALTVDKRITQTEGAELTVQNSRLIMRNTYGMNLKDSRQIMFAYVSPIAKETGDTATGFKLCVGRNWSDFNAERVGREAAAEVLSMLHAKPVASGTYRVIMRYDAMQSLLRTFCGVFSAENAQQKLSMLKDREGERIAAECVTLVDDPLLPGGFATRSFDGEGVATKTKTVIENGVLKTLLHNRKTAFKQGVETTGNAVRSGAVIHVGPSNFYIRPGTRDLNDLLTSMGDGLLITDISGLHAGANAISGDFSLLSKGYLVQEGKLIRPVEQITIAGNFYDVLMQINAIGSDLVFPGSGVGSPSIDIGVLKVSGV